MQTTASADQREGEVEINSLLRSSIDARVECGKSDEFWANIYKSLDKLIYDTPTTAQSLQEIRVYCIRLRNLVAQVPDNQTLAVTAMRFASDIPPRSAVHYLTAVMQEKTIPLLTNASNSSVSTAVRKAAFDACRAAIQAIANIAGGNNYGTNFIGLWTTPDSKFLPMLAKLPNVDGVFAHDLAIMMMNFCQASENSSHGTATWPVVMDGDCKFLVATILERCVASIEDVDDNLFNVVSSLLEHVLRGGALRNLISQENMKKCAEYGIVEDWMQYRAGVLKLTASILAEQTDSFNIGMETVDELIHGLEDDVKYTVEHVRPDLSSPATQSKPVILDLASTADRLLIVAHTLEILAHVTGTEATSPFVVPHSAQIESTLESMLKTLIGFLYFLDSIIPQISRLSDRNQSPSATPSDTAATASTTPESVQQMARFKRDVVQIIGNVSHRNKFVQDKIRELGGIPIVLKHCTIDELNPYIREYAVFAMHNILENNVENQTLVESMKPVNNQ